MEYNYRTMSIQELRRKDFIKLGTNTVFAVIGAVFSAQAINWLDKQTNGKLTNSWVRTEMGGRGKHTLNQLTDLLLSGTMEKEVVAPLASILTANLNDEVDITVIQGNNHYSWFDKRIDKYRENPGIDTGVDYEVDANGRLLVLVTMFDDPVKTTLLGEDFGSLAHELTHADFALKKMRSLKEQGLSGEALIQAFSQWKDEQETPSSIYANGEELYCYWVELRTMAAAQKKGLASHEYGGNYYQHGVPLSIEAAEWMHDNDLGWKSIEFRWLLERTALLFQQKINGEPSVELIYSDADINNNFIQTGLREEWLPAEAVGLK